MNKLTTLIASCLLAPASLWAAATDIAQVPVLNISGTGSIKPNIMLLLDNSGSMDWAYMPDYVGGGTSSASNMKMCRTGATYAVGRNLCKPGDPPFMASTFNSIYYNPKVYYEPPRYHDGTSYPSMTAATTSNWTLVPTDGYNIQNNDMFGNTASKTDLVTGFPDRKWCTSSSSSSCQTNTAYTYPDASYTSPVTIYGAPYYYNINVQEYCTDTNLSVCQSVVAGAPAPAGYPIPARVRWCNNSALTDNGSATSPSCQAKYIAASHFYPRFSVGLAGTPSYGTLSIGLTTTATKTGNGIAGVTVNGSSIIGTSTISTSTYAPNTASGQQELATRLASKIISTTSTPYYLACVNTPNVTTSPAVPACSTYGVTLGSNEIVAIFPVNCGSGKTGCTLKYDNSSAGFVIAATSLTPVVAPAAPAIQPTALITLSGSTPSSSTAVLNDDLSGSLSLTLGGTTVSSSSITLGKNKSATSVVSSIVSAIGTGGLVKAYIGGNSITPTCQAKTSTTVCLVDSTTTTNGKSLTRGSVTNNGSLGWTYIDSAGGAPATAATTDQVSPLTGSSIAAGGGSPDPFTRVDIVSSRITYPRSIERVDCTSVAGSCSYAEEMTNFANWYTYYHTRMQMMKTSVGQAFSTLGGSYRVGFARLRTLSSNSYDPSKVDIFPDDFSGSNRSNWYTKLYASDPNGGTPLREALNAIGKMYANTALNTVRYPCQQNYTIVTTDGYWNNNSYSGGLVNNNDNVQNAARFCTKAGGCFDGVTSPSSAPSLADVALYWYNGGSNTGVATLRPDLEPSVAVPGVVPVTSADPNTHLHMTTFTMGLGVSGLMTYEPDYDKTPAIGGDFYNLITNASNCPWNAGGSYIWPDPVGDTQTAVDDLWHAAVNGHGKYFSASDPKAVVDGLSSALLSMTVRSGAASAAATSTPNVSQQDNDIFSATFTTGKWYGELFDQKIDVVTGNVQTNLNWLSTNTLGLQVAAATDTRVIKMLDTSSSAPALKNFNYSSMSAMEKAWFNNKGSLMVQFGGLTPSDQVIANNGDNLVKWLRGQQQYADDNIYRAYAQSSATPPSNFSGTWNAGIPIVLGDIDTAKPAYLRKPTKNYTMTGYSAFVTANTTRPPTVFAAANDGMLHAFDADNGNELWAYVPRITMPKLHNLAAMDYSTNHQFSVDGSPEIADVQIGGVWKTVLVAGLNAGGRGYYALDVTDPTNPKALWEFCADSTICAKNDPDLGLTFGNAQFGYWDSKWVVMVSSGYNNTPGTDGVSTGNGNGYLYVLDAADGTVLKKLSTTVGDTTTPSGFAKITAITNNPHTDPKITYVYGGDNQGNLFRFDFTNPSPSITPVVKLATLGSGQPITVRPEVSFCTAGTSSLIRVVLIGTGRLLGVSDTTTTGLQSVYLIKDSGTALGSLNGNSTMVRQTLSTLPSGAYTITTNSVNLGASTVNGWYTDLSMNTGERVNLDPKVVFNTAVVVSNRPTSSSSCSVGGTSFNYQFDLCTGSYTDASTQTVGGLLSNSSAAVGFIIIKLPSGTIKMISTLADGSKLTTAVQTSSSGSPRKAGWRSVKN